MVTFLISALSAAFTGVAPIRREALIEGSAYKRKGTY